MNPGGRSFESMETYKDLFDNAHDLIHLVDLDGTLLHVNKAWIALLEYSQEEIRGKTIYHFIAERDRQRYRTYRENIINGGNSSEETIVTMQTKTGREVSLEGFVSVRHDAGKPIYTRGIFRDITIKLQNEAKLKSFTNELKEREANLQNLLSSAPDAVIVIDKNSNITYWNPKAAAIFGWSAEEALGKHLAELVIPPQYHEAHASGMQRFLTTGEAHVLNQTIEITALNKKREEFFVSLTISSTQQKGEIAFVAFLRDISEQKRNALELQKTIEALKRSNQSLEEFAHAASHDLKEPIRKVHTFADLLRTKLAGRMTEEELRLFDRMENAAARMRLLVDDLLEYSHLTIRPPEKQAIDLNEKLKKVLGDLELAVEEKKASISIGNLPVVNGYRRQLQQLFQNLISNSLKYTKEGIPPHVMVDSRLVKGADVPLVKTEEELDKTFHLIKVRDNGIGFELGEAKRIFNMFQRLHGKSEYSGTGIGLSIARKVVENHQGYIWAESEPGKGACFFILLPA